MILEGVCLTANNISVVHIVFIQVWPLYSQPISLIYDLELEDDMCELTMTEIEEVSGGSFFYALGYFCGRMAANAHTIDMSGALAMGA